MTEDFLCYLWRFQLVKVPLYTDKKESITVKNQGLQNKNAGPDFTNALIKIGSTTWAGSVEVHVKSSDWIKHKHVGDKNYDMVILHVVYENDEQIYHNKKEAVPTLELKNKFNKKLYDTYLHFLRNTNWIPCEKMIHSIDRFKLFHFINRLAIERLERKTQSIQEKLHKSKQDLEQSFYEQTAQSFGLKANEAAFEMLAKSISIAILAKHKNNLFQIEALLFGQAGMLNKIFKDDYPNQLKAEYHFLQKKYNLQPVEGHLWKFLRLRPSNFPTIRLAQFAMLIHRSSALFSKIIGTEKLEKIYELFGMQASAYWDTHYRFDSHSPPRIKKLGKTSIRAIVINAVIPFLFVYSKHTGDDKYYQRAIHFLDQLPGEKNAIIKKWEETGIVARSAFYTQALLELKSYYCDVKRCLECEIGHELLNRK